TFPFAPLLLCPLTRWRRAIATGALAVALLFGVRLTLGAVPNPMPDVQTWSLQDIAMRTSLMGGTIAPSAWAVRIVPALKILGAILVASLILAPASLGGERWRAGRVLVAAGVLHV